MLLHNISFYALLLTPQPCCLRDRRGVLSMPFFSLGTEHPCFGIIHILFVVNTDYHKVHTFVVGDWLRLLPFAGAVGGVAYLAYKNFKQQGASQCCNTCIDKGNPKVVTSVDIEDITGDKVCYCRCWKSKKVNQSTNSSRTRVNSLFMPTPSLQPDTSLFLFFGSRTLYAHGCYSLV